jgi:hypothetical protein
MNCQSETLDTKLEKERKAIVKETHDNHAITKQILVSLGQTPDFCGHYGMGYTACTRSFDTVKGRYYYSEGDEAKFINDGLLFGRVNSDVIGYRKEGDSYLDLKNVPGLIKQKIKELVKGQATIKND